MQDVSPAAAKRAVRPKIVFVSGVLRSGTTLLSRVIALSCQAPYIREESSLHVVTESFETLDRFGAFHLLSRDEYVKQYRELIAGLTGLMAQKINADTLVLKDPFAVKTLAYFCELMPETKFVISIRNPLGTVASIFRVSERQRQQGKKTFLTPKSFGDIVVYVAQLCEVIMAVREKDNICVIRYEDLVMRDAAALERLQEFIGAKVCLDLEDESDTYQPDHAFWTPECGGKMAQSSLEKHKAELTQEQTNLVAKHLSRFNAMFGYR